ncbi:hypothetical protein H632_c2504p0, partial [Helicosporidium sp. ATCC 50920]
MKRSREASFPVTTPEQLQRVQQAFEARVTPPPAPSPMEFELNAYSSHGLDSLFHGEALAYRPSPVGKDARRSTPVRADGYAAPSSLEERSAALSTLAMSHDHLESGCEALRSWMSATVLSSFLTA